MKPYSFIYYIYLTYISHTPKPKEILQYTYNSATCVTQVQIIYIYMATFIIVSKIQTNKIL